MAKDIEEIDDKIDDKAPAKMSIREAITAARDEIQERDDDNDSDKFDSNKEDRKSKARSNKKEEKEERKKPVESSSGRKKTDSENTDGDDGALEEEKEPTENEDEDEDEIENEVENEVEISSQLKVETKAPVGWTKAAKEKWNDLPAEVQSSILKREKEVSDGFAGTKVDKARLKEIDDVISPRLQAIQQFGATPAQTIDRLFLWMEALSNPNNEFRQAAFKTLAQNCNVDVSQLASQRQTQQQTSGTNSQQQEETTEEIPTWAKTIIREQNASREAAATQRQANTLEYINNWSKDKQHFEKVRGVMTGLIQSGAIPLENNQITYGVLDKAYDKALRSDDDIWNDIQEEKKQKEVEERKAAAAKKAEQARKAAAKNVSLRPNAPTLNGGSSNQKSNSNSIRGSILAAIQEQQSN